MEVRTDSLDAEHRELQDRTAVRNHHDGEYEHRFDKTLPVEVSNGGLLAMQNKQSHYQQHRPESENHFDFAQQMPDTVRIV